MVKINTKYFDIEKIAASGQCFRMHKTAENEYVILASDKMLVVEKDNDETTTLHCTTAEYQNVWKGYFDIGNNAYKCAIKEAYFRGIVDVFAFRAARYSTGIVILQQDLWETICNYLIARAKSVTQISKCIEKMCMQYGNPIGNHRGITYYSFPSPYKIVKGGIGTLSKIGLGFRTEDVFRMAQQVINGKIDLDYIRKANYEDGYAYLTGSHKVDGQAIKDFRGIGPKVANCILLYGCHHLEAVPKDTWINKVKTEDYKGEEPWWFDYYYGGIIQQFVFFYKRNMKGIQTDE